MGRSAGFPDATAGLARKGARMLNILVYREGRDFELSPRAAAFRNSRAPVALLAGPEADQGFRRTDDPDEADCIVFPYNLECIVYPERALAASYFIRDLPHYHSHEAKHVFFNFHDRNQPLVTEALVITDDPDKGNRGDPHLATFPHVPGEHVLAAAPDFAFGAIKYDTNYVGTLSYPIRLAMAESVRREPRLRYFIQHPNTLDWEDSRTSYLHMDDAAKKAALARLFVEKMTRSWTTLCPRGMGSSSIRFFETLCLGRIPVHVSDAYILPRADVIDYASFCLLLPESAVAHTGEILRQWLAGKSLEERVAMCLKARQVWEEHFHPGHLQRYALSLLEGHVAARPARPGKPRHRPTRHELRQGPPTKPHYQPGAFDRMEIDDRRLWIVSGLTPVTAEDGTVTVGGLQSRLAPSELVFLTNFASLQDVNAVLASPAPDGATGAVALANGLFLGRKLNATLHLATDNDPAALGAALDAAGTGYCTRLAPLGPGETPAAFLKRFQPRSVHAVIVEQGGVCLDPTALDCLRPDGVVLRRNRNGHGFSLALARPERALEQMVAAMTLLPPGRPDALGPGPLVLGLVARYDAAKIAPFVRSLRRAGFAGTLVLFTLDVAPETHRFLAENGCLAVSVTVTPLFKHISVNILRYFLYRSFLAQYGEAFSAVFLTDVGDVVFQGDVFSHLAPGRLTVFAEANTVAGEPWNAGWIRNLYGPEVFAAMADQPVVCSGTTLGETAVVRAYLAAMTEHLQPMQVALTEPAMPGTGMHGADQGVHNYLLRHGLTPPFVVRANADAAVFTYDGRYSLLPDGRVATADGRPFTVVHQYNRNPVLMRHIFAQLDNTAPVAESPGP